MEGDTIQQVGEDLSVEGAEIIDATDKVVCPGFIDIHNHADLALLDMPQMEPYVRQGLTTTVGGMCGFGIAPSNDITKEYYTNIANRLLSVTPRLSEDLPAFEEKIRASGIGVNLAYFVPQGNVRALFFGARDDAATDQEIEQMREVVRQHMEAGAFGMSTGLVYPPGSVSTTEELVELARVVGEYDGLYVSHMRNEGAHVIDIGMSELVRIAREAPVRAHISHWSVISSSTGEMTPRVIQYVEDARAEGLDVTADVTVYEDAVTPLAFVMLNTWVFEDFDSNLTDPASRVRILEEMFQKIDAMFLADAPWFIRVIPKFILKRIMFPVLAKKVTILSCPNNTQVQGKTIHEAIKTLYPKAKIRDGLLDLLRDEGGGILITLKTKDEEHGIIPLFRQAFVGPSSDAIPIVNQAQNVHPRNYSTFPRVLQRWVREKQYVALETAIHKMTGHPAGVLQLPDRGVIAEGKKADVVVFDPATIRENGTIADGRQFPSGIDHVFVNGVAAVTDGKSTGALSGRLLKHGQ